MSGDLFSLPWQIQLVLVFGYLGYNVAYTGLRVAHQTLDSISIVLAFGGIGLISLHIADYALTSLFKMETGSLAVHLSSALFSLVATLFTSVIWRRIRNWVKKLLNKLSASTEDGLTTAWHSITMLETVDYVHLTVTLKSGKVYESYPLAQFNGIQNGPCVLGTDGSIGMFVTRITEKDGTQREAQDLADGEGFRITYIPKDQIEEIDFRRSA